MAKDFEQPATIIPENEFQPELEKDVAYYLSIAEQPKFISKKRYTPNNPPEKFSSIREEREYQIEEIRRISEGYDGLSGKGYGFLNYARIRDPERGKIRPEFRSKQEEFFQKIISLQKNPGRSLVGFKRRRFGYSTIASWDVLHDCMTTPYFTVGMNSKSENDSRLLFKNIKFIYQNLPEWLRPRATASDRRDFMEFAWYEKDQAGNRIKKGLESWISCVAPVAQAHEGNAYGKLLIDEAGKIECLLDIWQFAEDCLRINTRRVSPAIIMGTVGSIDKDGKGLMELYMNNEAYLMDRFCFFGYNGLIVDEYGNDLIEHAIRFIVYERKRMESATRKVRETQIQKYPLCERDAFYTVSDGGVGNPQLINNQIIKIISNPPIKRVGYMRRKPDGGVDFVPDNLNGKVINYELPEPGRINAYVAGADPSDHENVKKTRDSSELALEIMAKPFGLGAPRVVLEYCDRPDKLDKFFEQAAMCLQWFNNTKVLIEDNRARMLNYFKEHYPHLLPLVPKSIATAKKGFEMKNSLRMTEERKQQIMGLMEDYIDNYSEFIPSVKLLEQHKVFADMHADDDLAIAHGLCLIMLQADKRPASTTENTPTSAPKLENINGILRLVNYKGVPISRVNLPNHPLFRK